MYVAGVVEVFWFSVLSGWWSVGLDCYDCIPLPGDERVSCCFLGLHLTEGMIESSGGNVVDMVSKLLNDTCEFFHVGVYVCFKLLYLLDGLVSLIKSFFNPI